MLEKLNVRKAVVLSTFTSLVMGGFVVISRSGITESFSAADFTFFRYLSGILLIPIFLTKPLRNLGGIGWKRGILLTVFAGWPFNMLLMSGFNFAPAAHGAVFAPGTMPMFTAIFAWFLLKNQISLARVVGLLVLMIGLVALGWGGLVEGSIHAWKGDLMFMAAAMLWGGFTVCIRHWQIDPIYGVSVVAVFSCVSFAPIYLILFDSSLLSIKSSILLLQIFYHSCLVGLLAVVLFTICIPVLGPPRTALFMALVPVFGTLFGIIFLKEIPGWIEFGGIVLVIVGMLAAMGVKLNSLAVGKFKLFRNT